MSGSGFVAVLVIDLHFPDAGSLKGKRKELSSIKAQLHGRLGAAVAEVDHQDLWQRATLDRGADRRLAGGAVRRGRQCRALARGALAGRRPDPAHRRSVEDLRGVSAHTGCSRLRARG